MLGGVYFLMAAKELIDKEMQRCRVEYADDKEFMRLVDSILDRYQ